MPKRIILFINPADTSRHTASANTAIYPNLGLLTLTSNLKAELDDRDDIQLGYLDGVVIGNDTIAEFIAENAASVVCAAFSVLTSNYGAAISLAEQAKAANPNIVTVFGNDHFSARFGHVLARRPMVDYGFAGNDVVLGFAKFARALIEHGSPRQPWLYPGLVYRDAVGQVCRNPEDPTEIHGLAPVDYSLMDWPLPHAAKYLAGQHRTYLFMRQRNLRSQVIDIGRGCIKFSGERVNDVPVNACDFCAIIPGSKAISTLSADRAWEVIHNAYLQGYNYLYVTADELPLTMWPMIRAMAENPPEWFRHLPEGSKPKLFGYARAEAFALRPERMDILINTLGFEHFFIGFDGLSEISLAVMNKQPANGKESGSLMRHNLEALDRVAGRGGMVTAGIVLTHLGITPQIMEENFRMLESIVDSHPDTFAALDFGPLCPIPGSQAFLYLVEPETAIAKARQFGLRVNPEYLAHTRAKYLREDLFDMDELVDDFIAGCCPDITRSILDEHLALTTKLAQRHRIVVGGGV